MWGRSVAIGLLALAVAAAATPDRVSRAAQKPPPGAIDALMHCAPRRPDYTPDPRVAPPTEARAVRDGERVRITWRDNADNETCYGVLRFLPPSVDGRSVEQITLLIVALTDATEATVVSPAAERACFAVYAGNAAGRSAPSDLACPDPPPAASAPPPPSVAFLAPNRERLAICVDGVGDAAAAISEGREQVESALAVVASHPLFERAGLGAAQPVVDEGCPHDPYLLEPGVYWEDGIPIAGAGRVVPEVSIYRLFVFLVTPADLARAIDGTRPVRSAAEEMLCAGHQCWEVTTGIYLTPDEAADEAFLVEWLLRGLGLELIRPVEIPPDVPRGR
jgi:hypothetical protein